MRKHLLFTFLLFSHVFLFGQNILVNPAGEVESGLDAEELTIEVLIDGGACSSISNFELKDNPDSQFPSQNRSWGYFQKADSEFPFESGIVMTSGYARRAEGPDNGNIESEGDMFGWTGDPDTSVMADNTTYNATVFEFDFVPYGNDISFNYIFASEEYPSFTCSEWNDAFGFIISGPGITPDPGLSGKNIALLPNGDYVTINNVNYDTCGDAEYYTGQPLDPYFDDITYGGRTLPLTAYSEVQPGETYHIKLVVSDAGDGSYDSAVFLEAGSFSLGGTLVDLSGVEIGEDQTLCDLSEYTMVVNLEAPDATFQWNFNGGPIPGATGQEYTATESGHYSVDVFAGGCSTTVEVDLQFSVSPDAADISDFQCTTDGAYIYNLHDFEGDISATPGVTYGFYQSFEGADQEIPFQLIPNPDAFEVTDQVIVYVRVENADGCYKVIELTLEAGIGPQTQPADYAVCDENGDGTGTFNLTDYDDELVISDPTGLTYEYYLDADGTQPITNPANYENTSNPQTVYVKIWNPSAGDEGCVSYEELNLFVKEFPELQDDELTVCDNLHDNSEFVDLTGNEIVVTPGIGVNLHYFPTLADLQSGTGEITNPANYEITSSPTEIYINVEAVNSDCRDYAVYTINLNESPDAQNAVLENCSINDISTYHLPDADGLIVPDTSGLNITYHLTYNNAVNATGELPDNYENTSADQVIYVRVEDANGCYDIAEVTLTTVSVHEILDEGLTQCDDPYQVNDETSVFDLTQMNDDVETALGGTGYSFEYYLTLENAQQGLSPITDPAEFENTSSPQTIYVRAFGNDEGCAGTAEFQIEVNPVAEFNLEDEIAFCETEGEKSFTFGGDYETYAWYDPDGNLISTSAYVVFEQEGIYSLEVTDAGSDCPGRRDIEVIFDEAPAVTQIDVNGNTVTVNVAGSQGPFEYSYNNGLSWHDSYILNNVPSGIHYMLVRSIYGCISEQYIFGVLGIPNVITPNGDGYNDFMTIRGLEMYPDAHIKIFDRYGKIFVDRQMGTEFTWDGKYLGNPIPSGDYWYIITVDEKSVSGHISIRNRN
jgi:gliding motility-associated-like protein